MPTLGSLKRKAELIRTWRLLLPCFRPLLLCAALAPALAVAGAADAGEARARIGDRCAAYGPGFMDLGNGVCGRVAVSGPVTVDGRMRINPASRTTYSEQVWSTNGTASAELRSDKGGMDKGGMVPGISNARHLRIDSGADPYER